MVLQDFDGHNLIGAAFPALCHLPKGAAAKKLQHLIAVGHRAEDFMLHQLVVPLAVGVTALGGGGGVGDRLGRGGAASSSSGCTRPTCHTVGDHRGGELLQDLHAVTAVHLLALALAAVRLLATMLSLQGGGGGHIFGTAACGR